jgi:hypothetical protein
LRHKRQFFRWIFRRKYCNNHNIGPCTYYDFGRYFLYICTIKICAFQFIYEHRL